MSEAMSTWTGFKGRVGGWLLASPLRRVGDIVVDGDVSGQLRKELELSGSEQVIELGCGSGYFTLPIAKQLMEDHPDAAASLNPPYSRPRP